jgi:phenylalanine-4-hydroxylase
VNQHASGFSTPLGRARDLVDKPLSRASAEDLRRLGLGSGQTATLHFGSGFEVSGQVAELVRDGDLLVLIKWQDCTVIRGDQVYFQPAWGDFDMAVGESVVSVAGGPADPENYGLHDVGTATTKPGRSSPYTADELSVFKLYQEVRDCRERLQGSGARSTGPELGADVAALAATVAASYPREWLLRLELAELASRARLPQASRIAASLTHDAAVLNLSEETRWLIRQGLALAEIADETK